MAFTDTWNGTFEGLPPDSEAASGGAGRITKLKLAIRERMAIEHSWAGDANDGKHKDITVVSINSGVTCVAFAGATTLLTLGGTGATSVVAIPGTKASTAASNGSVTFAGGIGVAGNSNFDGTLGVSGTATFNGRITAPTANILHSIGVAATTAAQLRIGGVMTSAAYGIYIDTTTSPAVSADSSTFLIFPTIVENSSGTHNRFSSLEVRPPIITAGAASLTNAAAIRITGAPTGATNSYALWVEAGDSRFAGAVTVTDTLSVTGAMDTTSNLQLMKNTATAAGGTTDGGLLMGSALIGVFWGSGVPSITPANGSIYLRTDGAQNADIYTRRGGVWKAITSAA